MLFWVLVPCISLAQTQSVASLQAELQQLLAQVSSLETQIAAQGGNSSWCYSFTTNLSIGMSGNAVTELQTVLQKDGESVQVTGTFDDHTASAVTAFQEQHQTQILAPYGLAYGTGYAGKSTRAELNALFGCTAAATVPVNGNQTTIPIDIAIKTLPIHVCPAWGCNGPGPISPPISITPSLSTTLAFSITNSSSSNIALSGTPGTQYGAFIEVTNSGNATVTGAASASWISIGPIGGKFSLSPGQQDTIVMSVNVPSLAAGATLSGTMTISGNFPTITIPVTFTNNANVYQSPSVSQAKGLTATVNGNAVTLNWQPATASDGGTVIYNIYRTFTTTTCTINSVYLGQVHENSYTDSPLPAGTYHYCVLPLDTAQNNAGFLSANVSATVPPEATTVAQPVTMQVDSATPVATQVPTGATGVNLLAFDIVNPSNDPVRITQVEALEQVGIMSSLVDNSTADFINLNLSSGANGQAVSGGQFQLLGLLPNPPAPWSTSAYPSNLVIPANSTEELLVTGSVPQYAVDPSMVGTTGVVVISPLAAIDTNTSLPVDIVGDAYGNMMTIIKGQ